MIIGQTWMQPDKMPAWELFGANLLIEYRQCLEEGKDVAAYEPLIRSISSLKDGRLREELADALHETLLQAKQQPDYPFDEPSDLEAIRLARPAQRPLLPEPAAGAALREKIAGAWHGRVSGCLLGKPVEGWRTPKLKRLLQGSGNFPLQTYIRRDDGLLAELGMAPDRCWIDTIKNCAPSDDDTNYTVLAAARLVGRYGRAFTPEQAARTWLDSQPMTAYCTAERVAFRNFVIGILPPQSALYKNPFREWIGAQIRADYFGYINPGAPAAAAAMAWRDASISHVKNGIYGEMFVAAMLAAAAATDDIGLVIRAGLAEIPEKSRLQRDITRIIDWHAAGLSADACFDKIHAQFDEILDHDWCHTNSNAMIVAAALLYGGHDFGRAICLAVATGFDTDCNGATVGSIVGMIVGKRRIPASWTEPYGGLLDTSILDVGKVRIDDMVDLTMTHLG